MQRFEPFRVPPLNQSSHINAELFTSYKRPKKIENRLQTGEKTDSHEDIQMGQKSKNPLLSLVNAGPPDRVSALFTEYGGHKIRQMIVILKITYAKANSPFC